MVRQLLEMATTSVDVSQPATQDHSDQEWGVDGDSRMKLSKKTDYALRVLFTLVERRGQGPVSMTELAKTNEVPKRFLEHIMLDLKKKKWVASTPGRKGGYVLAQDPERITMGQVVRYFDGILAPIGCVSVSCHEPCSQSPSCRFRRVLLEIRNMTARYMDSATLADVHANKPVNDNEVFSLELPVDLIAGGGI
jgi:Rrf2 family protein